MKPILLGQYLKNRFGERVQRIPLDPGFSCPNRVGVDGGCVYCDEMGSAAPWIEKGMSIEKQLEIGANIAFKRYGAKKYVAYFQAFTTTFADIKVLESMYEKAVSFPGVVGMAVSTRPDVLSDEVLELLKKYSNRTYLWVELGAQSMLDKSLEWMKRGHNSECFKSAAKRLKDLGIELVGHLIFGLPTESRQDTLRSFKLFLDTNVDGFKIHMLHVIKGTELERMYNENPFSLISMEDYVDLVKAALDMTPEGKIIHRLTSDVARERLVAPDWILRKNEILKAILSN